MQHPTVCSSCVSRQHGRGVVFASTDAIFDVFVPQRASSNLIKHQTALCYRKDSKRICSACFPTSPLCFCQPADTTEEATAFSAASFLFKPSLLWSSLPCSHAHPCPGHSSCVTEGLLSFSPASQTQLGWQNDVVCLEQLCLSAERCQSP